MAAAATDLFQEVGLATATTLDANYTINDSTLTVASTSGMPTATGITVAIDVVDSNGEQVPGTYNEYVGVVASASSLSSVDWVGGSGDRNYSAGATTRVYIPVSAERENRLVEGALAHADQDGTLKAGAVDNAAVLASDVVTTAKILNLNVTTGKIAAGAVTPDKLDLDPLTAYVATSETTTSASYADLATTTDTITVTVGANGLLLISIAAWLVNNSANSAHVAFALSGTNTLAAADKYSLYMTGTSRIGVGASFLLTGLNTGATVIKMKYKASGGTATFEHRHVSAVPL